MATAATATAATAAVDPAAAAPVGKAKGKKKLIIILIGLLLVLLLGGGATLLLMKKKAAADAEADEGDGPAVAQVDAKSPGHPPTYVALDPFTVNLADKDAERYAQVAVTLEVDDPKFAEQMKGYMPAIRNAILLILAHKTSQELLERAGKEALAAEIMREAVRPMGIEVAAAAAVDEDADDSGVAKKNKKKKGKPGVHNPVRSVLFANFIVQ